jgi:phosphotransferase system enzyme I (PtsI)
VETRKGTAVSPGIAAGRAFVLESEGMRIARKFLMPDEVGAEIARFDKALAASGREIHELARSLHGRLDDGYAAADIFRMHVGVLEDPRLREQVAGLVTNRLFTPEYAVSQVLRRYRKSLEEAGDTYLLQRVRDFDDIEQRLLRNLLGERREDLAHLQESIILVAHDLTPSQTVSVDREKVLAIATEAGGRTSHTAILARALGIPAVVGVVDLLAGVAGGDNLIVDGGQGVVIIAPDELTYERYQRKSRTLEVMEERIAEEFCNLPAVTPDGRGIAIEANIELPGEVEGIVAHGAEGVGLYRTEFLYHTATKPPTEETHFNAYMDAIRHLRGHPMTIRILDLGADKFPLGFLENNPFLGCRSMRLLRLFPEIFRHQIRAILRASTMGKLRFMFPLISSLQELRECKAVVAEVMAELDEKETPYDRKIQIGMMIEVPSAAVMADAFAKEVDFFSIGTNDLIQYSLAVDRDNEHVAHLYSPSDPSVLRMIRNTLRAADEAGIECSVCGEMAGDVIYALLLVGMGFRKLSMAPTAIPDMKRIIRSVKYEEARLVAEKALRFDCAEEITDFLQNEVARVFPELEIPGREMAEGE